MDCSKLLKKGKTLVKTLLLHCFQFGDSGKGKLSDLLAGWANIIFRATGGPNAGHTICCGGQELVTHLVPSGILYDSLGKINIIGSGTAVYPWALLQELEQLKAKGLSYNNLRLAFNAKLTLPTQVVWDRVLESVAAKEKIGSTGKGIAPTYADFVNRFGLSVNDLINPDFFHRKLKRHVEYYRKILKSYDSEMIKTIMGDKYLESGLYYNPKEIFDLEAIYQRYQGFGQELKGLITDTDTFIRSNVGKLNILGEGSQGDLLDIEYGTYPYVTSSSCTVPGLAKGAGLDMGDIDLSIGIFRGFYMTRVGKGPFPTELGGQRSDDWCNGGEATKEIERRLYGQISVDETDEFLLGVLLRHKGNEYGSTTERPRRTGWLDLPLLQYVLSLKFNNPDAVLTK
ncbi:MAG: adenylosuccinate synthetase, partial [Candidatus Falkowbacteria bacterium]|nr:adenylosuccinate synthetase [Candidatus Falkowbacteria bacterium]